MTSPWDRTLPVALICAALAAAFFFAPSPAAAQERTGASFDLFGSYLRRDDADEEAVGARGGYRFTERWAAEGSLSYLQEGGEGSWLGDLSGKAYLTPGRRAELYVLGGAGRIRFPGGHTEETLNAGLGAEVALGERAYLRPDVRSRWLADELSDEPLLDYSLGIGFRF